MARGGRLQQQASSPRKTGASWASPWSLQAQVLSVPWDTKEGATLAPLHHLPGCKPTPPHPSPPEWGEAGTTGQGGPVWPLCPWQARPRLQAVPCGGLLSCMVAVGGGGQPPVLRLRGPLSGGKLQFQFQA